MRKHLRIVAARSHEVVFILALLLYGALTVTGGCTGCDDRFKHEREFFKQPLAKQHKKFLTLPPDRQVQIYLAAQSREPPDISFCQEIGESSGPAAIPVVLRALATEKEIYAKVDLLRALECVADTNSDVCDSRVLEAARKAANSIEYKEPRLDAEQIVGRLKRCSNRKASVKDEKRNESTGMVPKTDSMNKEE